MASLYNGRRHLYETYLISELRISKLSPFLFSPVVLLELKFAEFLNNQHSIPPSTLYVCSQSNFLLIEESSLDFQISVCASAHVNLKV